MSDHRDKMVLLAFWATWCIPCRAELSKLEETQVRSKDLVVLAISWESRETVRNFLGKHPYHLPFFIDVGHKLSDHFQVDKLPGDDRATTARPGPRAVPSDPRSGPQDALVRGVRAFADSAQIHRASEHRAPP